MTLRPSGALDVRIFQLLHRDGLATPCSLAVQLGVTPATVLEELESLEARGLARRRCQPGREPYETFWGPPRSFSLVLVLFVGAMSLLACSALWETLP